MNTLYILQSFSNTLRGVLCVSTLSGLCISQLHAAPVFWAERLGASSLVGTYPGRDVIDPGAGSMDPVLPPAEEPPVAEPPPLPVNRHVSRVILDDPGRFLAVEGSACGISEGYDTGWNPFAFDKSVRLPLEIDGMLDIPTDFAEADGTVILNGWRLAYEGEDHHINEVDAHLTDISIADNVLSWRAQGMLDDNDHNTFEYCYQYLAMVWDRADIHAIADTEVNASRFDGGNTTALKSLLGAAVSPWTEPYTAFPGKTLLPQQGNVAVLPNGFSTLFFDHHLLQLAYHKGAGVQYLQGGLNHVGDVQGIPGFGTGVDTSDPGLVTWVSQAIIKDNESRRRYSFYEYTSLLAGHDVRIIEPPFTILPSEDQTGGHSCIGALEEVKTRDVEVSDLPFDYALPVLSGWDIAYGCDDQEVLKLGVWVHDIHYEKGQGPNTGTLRYKVSSRLRDDDMLPDHVARYKVSVLGFDAGGPYYPALTLPGNDGAILDGRDRVDPEPAPSEPDTPRIYRKSLLGPQSSRLMFNAYRF